MNVWYQFPFVRLAGILILLIFVVDEFSLPIASFIYIYGIGLLSLFIGYTLAISSFRYRRGYWILIYLGIAGVMVGWIGTRINSYKPIEGTRHVALKDSVLYYKGSVIDEVKHKDKYVESLLEVTAVYCYGQWEQATGKIQWRVACSDDSRLPVMGGEYLLKGKPKPFVSFNNEGFDWGAYQRRNHIYLQQWSYPTDYILLQRDTISLKVKVLQLKRDILWRIHQYFPNKNVEGILKALLLGDKTGLSKELKHQYATTGVMHVLAVSGLHVGILLSIFFYLLRYYQQRIYWCIGITVTALLLLWGYVLLTGGAASVSRSALMYSVILIGLCFRRKANILNTIACSAVMLLLIDPYHLFRVGFQLSYTAVVGIVCLQPRIKKLWSPSSLVLKYLWELTAVSIAAQLATFPFSLYYFGLFPTYFLLANIPVILLVTLLVWGGVVTIGMMYIWEWGAIKGAILLTQLLDGMNSLVKIISRLSYASIELKVNSVQLGLLYILVLLIAIVLHQRRWYYFAGIYLLLLYFQLDYYL
ncbi:ComEC/Rec2 family competence protein [Algivirga pacifica]|uniref:Competence protein ComEC n=1 Tax=Algivirga pacifica TaxID=1162670 RepID=A0ABP9DDD3_9BACT